MEYVLQAENLTKHMSIIKSDLYLRGYGGRTSSSMNGIMTPNCMGCSARNILK
jgi:hypothetical protein